MTEAQWLTTNIVIAIHADQVVTHGGLPGIRDRGLLESALLRPKHRFNYEPTTDLHALAAAYGFKIAKNHPFVDGNKRLALQAMYVFLGIHDICIDASEHKVVSLMLDLAGSELDERQLHLWFQQNTIIKE